MPQIALQKILQTGLRELKDKPELLEDIFNYMHEPDIEADYGEIYVSKVKDWFLKTKIPVLHAWTLNADRIPCISIHLANEMEDESKASIGDFHSDGTDSDNDTTPLTTQLDIGIHASKNSDEVLWLYYIVTYVLFRNKRFAEKLGLQLQTFTASDWDKRQEYLVENIWTRWVRFRCTTQNFWDDADKYNKVDDIEVMIDVEEVEVDF